ncbi:MAG: hypothetical protein ABJG78_04600 [Cyclobacteriaceae bacterium]
MDSKLHIVYHCFCKNDWKAIVDEHFGYINNTTVHCTAIGNPSQLKELEEVAKRHKIVLEMESYENPLVYEHAAIELVEKLAASNPKDYVLYFHSKGTGRPVEVSNSWRNYMNKHFIAKYETHFEKLIRSGKDATGVLYCRKERDRDFNGLTTQFFAGNFWIASNVYLNSLPAYHELRDFYPESWLIAERYIGWGDPRVKYIKQLKTMGMEGLFGAYRKIKSLNKSRGLFL